MTDNAHLIIVTDLDGSLLDHHDYSYTAAHEALEQIRTLGIPLILNSSKTAAELTALRQTLDNHDPFIAENGAGVLIPEGCFRHLENTLPLTDQLRKKTFGRELQDVIQIVHRLRAEAAVDFLGFSEMSVETLIELTGLSEKNARMALDRDFTEPVVWRDSDKAWDQFEQRLIANQISAHRGGRFTHFSGGGDKGQALNWLRGAYEETLGKTVKVIALGDGENDLPMLRVADYPVIIRSPVNPLPALPERDDAIITDATGPAGWNRAVLDLLKQTGNC